MRGGQWQVLYLLRGLRDRGHQSRLLARGQLLEQAQAEGFDAAPFGGWIRDGSFDVVHVHDARAHSLAAIRRLFGGPPLIVSRRVAFPIQRAILSGWKYKLADRYIAISHCVAGKLMEAGIKSEAISVVYDGVPLLASGGATAGPVMALATDDPMKGSDLISQAREIAGVEIVFTRNLAAEIKQAGIFVYITRSEGLGSAALLAMAAGVPVIASRIGGLPEAVLDGESGVLVDNTAEKIAEAIQILLANPSLRERMGRTARMLAEQRFSIASMVEGTIQVYEQVQA